LWREVARYCSICIQGLASTLESWLPGVLWTRCCSRSHATSCVGSRSITCTSTTNRMLEHMAGLHAAVLIIKRDLCLHCVSMALTTLCFADSPGRTIHEAESTSTDF
jgi:hypothetical protein